MDLQKEREAFEVHIKSTYPMGEQLAKDCGKTLCELYSSEWKAWQAAKAQAVQEQDQQVWATSNLTWKDIAFRALSCKVLKSTENWVHVKNIACVGSTTASLICKKLGVDPDGTKFELIEARESANESK